MKHILQAMLLGTALSASGTALAQDQDRETDPSETTREAAEAAADSRDIVVTATRMGATRLQDTPLAITAFDERTLEVTGIKDIRDLGTLTPSLLVTQNASFSQVYIRGIGSNNVFGGSDPSSTIHLDGIYLARPASYLTNFLDVERIEVLRGPQGTLYGRNSVGGTINVISRKPDNDFDAKAQLTYGNYDFRRIEGYVSGPVIKDRLAASASIIHSRRDGYLENVAPGVGDADDEDTVGGRAQLRFTPSQPLEILLRADYLKSDDHLAGYVKLLQTTTDPLANSVLGDFRRIAVDTRPESDRRQWGVAATSAMTSPMRCSFVRSPAFVKIAWCRSGIPTALRAAPGARTSSRTSGNSRRNSTWSAGWARSPTSSVPISSTSGSMSSRP
jgi:iron complex outermembrane receptor protein